MTANNKNTENAAQKKRVNEIFYSLQGEGRHTGRPAVFIRFSGCNLKCSFCDTDFAAYTELSNQEIVAQAATYGTQSMVVLTGGEPSMQVDADLIDRLHAAGFDEVAMESNGSFVPPQNLDWLTVSPKGHPRVSRCDELKCIFVNEETVNDYGIEAKYYYLQPCDVGNLKENQRITQACINYIKAHPKWRLSLQTHKLVGFQ